MCERTCTIEGCLGRVVARGWCDRHYRRWKRTGDPNLSRRVIGDDVARFWSHVDKTDEKGCWVWTGSTSTYRSGIGYGTFRLGDTTKTAHVVAYLWANGEDSIPTGHVLDHLCRNQHCVNPAHLEPVTQGENVLRGALTKMSRERVAELFILWQQGATLAALARNEGVTPQAIRRRFKRLIKSR